MLPLGRKKRKGIKRAYKEGVRVYFQDDTRHIGCGWRTVSCQVGRKWVHVTEISTGRSARIPLRRWHEMIS